MTVRRVLLVFAWLLMAAVAIGAQDGLYGSAAPDDAAFVRIVHAAEGTGPVATTIGEADFGPIDFAEVSAYRPTATGLFRVSLAGDSLELVAQTGAYYTIAVTPDGALLFEDPEHTDPAEAQLFLYNLLASGSVGLTAGERDTQIIAPIDPGSSARVSVTPVDVVLVVERGGEPVAEPGDPGLERGESYSVFVFMRRSAPDAVVFQARVATE